METTKLEESYEVRMAREKEEERKRNENTKALIEQVLKILGFSLKKETNDDWSYVSLKAVKGDESLHFASGSYYLKDRISISGDFPRTEKRERVDPYRYGEKRHEITVSSLKSAEQIAKDIERRFLPRYRELLKRAADIVKQSNDYARQCARNLEAIKGGKLTDEELEHSTLRIEGLVYGEIRVRGEDAAVELRSVPIEMAEKILRLITKK